MLQSPFRVVLLGAFLLSHAKVLNAQAKPEYGLHDLVDSALTHLPAIKQKSSLLDLARVGTKELKHLQLPQWRLMEQVNLGTDNSLSGTVFPLGIVPSTSGGIRANQNGSAATGNLAVLYGEYELYNFGLNRSRIERSLSVEDLQRSDLEKERYLAAWRTTAWFLAAKNVEALLEIDGQNVLRYDSIHTVVVALARSGIRAGADSSAALAELSQARADQQRDEGRLGELLDALSSYSGLAADAWHLHPGVLPSGQTLGVLKSDTTINPLVAPYLRQEHIIGLEEKLIRKEALPRLWLTGSAWARGSSIQYNDVYHSLGMGLGYQRYNYSTGLTLTYTLNNGLYRNDRLLSNRHEAEAARQERKQQQLDLDIAVKQADTRLFSLERRISEGKVQVSAAEDTYRQRAAQYRAGLISLIDLTNASFVLYRSRADLLDTEGQLWQALLERSANAGTLFPFIQNIDRSW
jgi:outer membrane protein TolC